MMNHDEEFLVKTCGHYDEYSESALERHRGYCRRYHEHMKEREYQAELQLLARVPEFECVNCNYTFKGSASCKCQLRITADMRDAILKKLGEGSD